MHTIEIENKIANNIIAACRAAGSIIDAAHVADPKSRVPVVKLSERIAGELGMEQPHVYLILNMYVKQRPELTVYKGPTGGIGLAVEKSNAPVV
jgi:hypothetical protein